VSVQNKRNRKLQTEYGAFRQERQHDLLRKLKQQKICGVNSANKSYNLNCLHSWVHSHLSGNLPLRSTTRSEKMQAFKIAWSENDHQWTHHQNLLSSAPNLSSKYANAEWRHDCQGCVLTAYNTLFWNYKNISRLLKIQEDFSHRNQPVPQECSTYHKPF
jgi:hypothetical protein